MNARANILLLSGGVGGAKLVKGFYDWMKASANANNTLSVAVNIADDFTHLGLKISPDVDTVLYTLAEKNDRSKGWGLEHESWNCLEQLQQMGAPHWFQLGDRDLALHLYRTELLRQGKTLAQVCELFARGLGVKDNTRIFPVSEQPIRTRIKIQSDEKNNQWLDFQDYFVKQRCQPRVESIVYQGAADAQLAKELKELLIRSTQRTNERALDAIIIAPSNPLLSIEPMLSITQFREYLEQLTTRIPVIAVSPLIGGQAVKGPTAKIFKELDMRCDALGVAQCYKNIINGFIIDEGDRGLSTAINELGLSTYLCNTIMQDQNDQQLLASQCIEFAQKLAGSFK